MTSREDGLKAKFTLIITYGFQNSMKTKNGIIASVMMEKLLRKNAKTLTNMMHGSKVCFHIMSEELSSQEVLIIWDLNCTDLQVFLKQISKIHRLKMG
jgi:thioredoxin reductase